MNQNEAMDRIEGPLDLTLFQIPIGGRLCHNRAYLAVLSPVLKKN